MKKKLLTAMLMLVLLLCVLPMAAAAEDTLEVCPGHCWDSGVEVSPATCTAPATKRFTCQVPGCPLGSVVQPVGEPLGHDYRVTKSQEAICGTAGYTEYVCSYDASHTKTDIHPALTHSWDDGQVTLEATCTTAGKKLYTCQHENCPIGTVEQPYDALGHDWDDGVGTDAICGTAGSKTFTCRRENCKQTRVENYPALKHLWDDGKVTLAATCTTAGKKLYTCQNKNCPIRTVEQPYNALGHDWDDGVGTDAICGTAGSKTFTCRRENCKQTRVENYPALKHLWDDGKVTLAATCTTAGKKLYTCQNKNCPIGTVEQPYNALGHTWDEGKITTAPTCSKAGVKTYTCTVCKSGNVSTIKTESIPATGEHKYTLSRDKNYHYIYCANAGCTETYSEPHTYGRWKVVRTATPEKKGVLKKVCKVCDHALWTNYEYTDNPPTKDFVLVPMALTLTTGAALAVLLAEKKRRRS